MQLIVSTIVLLIVIYIVAYFTFPASFELRLAGKKLSGLKPIIPYICSVLGLVSGMIIAAFT
jgi:hypothetical protein